MLAIRQHRWLDRHSGTFDRHGFERLLVGAIPESVLFNAGTVFAGLLAVSDAYGFHGDEMYTDVARANPSCRLPALSSLTARWRRLPLTPNRAGESIWEDEVEEADHGGQGKTRVPGC